MTALLILTVQYTETVASRLHIQCNDHVYLTPVVCIGIESTSEGKLGVKTLRIASS